VRISPATTSGSRSVPVYIAVDPAKVTLRVGMFAQGRLLLDKAPPTLAVPATALREEAGTSSVLALVDGRIAKLAVTTGRHGSADGGPDLVEVRGGLAAGTQVVRQFDPRLAVGAPAVVAGAAARGR
jgi:multidrug efflux pump subunit AcrA (membrane-fusion protein)